jgi:dolichol-phosphate mannosyltransferase
MSNINETTGHSSDSNTIVVVPCYNESENIPRITLKISEIKDKGSLKGIDFVFVNDGSSDDSLALIKCFSEEYEWFKCANHEVNKGFAPALKTGREYALKNGYDIIGQIDCDMTHPLDMIDGMRDMLDGCDMVLASRYVGDGGMKKCPFSEGTFKPYCTDIFQDCFQDKDKGCNQWFQVLQKRDI